MRRTGMGMGMRRKVPGRCACARPGLCTSTHYHQLQRMLPGSQFLTGSQTTSLEVAPST